METGYALGRRIIMSTRLKIITLAAVFNLFFEYSVGGLSRIFNKPLTIMWLFFIYVCLFAMLEDLIRRYKITNLQIAVFAICFGILPELYLTGSIFTAPLIVGINWVSFLIINVVWWGMLQSLVTLYFANRLVPRKWDEAKPMGWHGWTACIAYMAFICGITVLTSTTLRRGPVEGYAIATLFQLAGAAWLLYSIPRGQRESQAFRASYLLDAVAFGTVVVFLGIGTFVAGNATSAAKDAMVNATALVYATAWSFVVLAGVIVHYLVARRPVPA